MAFCFLSPSVMEEVHIEYTKETNHLSVVGQDINAVPNNIANDYPNTKTLDLSFNNIQ